MHAIDASTRQTLGNLDHEFQNGAAPLGTWPQGKVIEDRQQLQMPNYPGVIQIVMGFWSDQVQENEGRLAVDKPTSRTGRTASSGPSSRAPAGEAPRVPHAPAPRRRRSSTASSTTRCGDGAGAWCSSRSFDGRPGPAEDDAAHDLGRQNVYVAFDCEDPDVWGTCKNTTTPSTTRRSCEAVLRRRRRRRRRTTSSRSRRTTSSSTPRFVTRRSDLEAAKKWESGLVTAVQVQRHLDDDKPDVDQGWTVEMKVPIGNLNHVPHVPPQKGDRWRFNAYRLEHLRARASRSRARRSRRSSRATSTTCRASAGWSSSSRQLSGAGPCQLCRSFT